MSQDMYLAGAFILLICALTVIGSLIRFAFALALEFVFFLAFFRKLFLALFVGIIGSCHSLAFVNG